MNHLLGEAGLAALRDFVAPGTLLALDYDGTLTPICTNPAEATLPPSARRHLQAVAQELPTWIITGRASADVRSLLDEVDGVEVIGNHGAETSALLPPDVERRVAVWREILGQSVGGLEGVSIEDKGYSLSVHYRRSPDWEKAYGAITETTRRLPGAKITVGKAVVNVVLPEAPDKGAALLLACRRAGCRRAIYVGDDSTDEDVFALNRPDEILTVRVGGGDVSEAKYWLEDPGEVSQMLNLVVRLSRARDEGRE